MAGSVNRGSELLVRIAVKAFRALSSLVPTLYWRPGEKPIFSAVDCLELANGCYFLSIYYAPDAVHRTATPQGETFTVPMLQMREVGLSEVMLVSQPYI